MNFPFFHPPKFFLLLIDFFIDFWLGCQLTIIYLHYWIEKVALVV